MARRFEFRGAVDGVTFVDDYAHLPSEVRAALAAARNGGWRRVVAVFQPHRYSRTAELWAEFGEAFADADVVVVTDVYGAGEAPVPGVSGPAGGRRRPPARTRACRCTTWPAGPTCAARWGACSGPATCACTLGAGDLTSLPDELLADAGLVTAVVSARAAGDLAGSLAGPSAPGRASGTIPSAPSPPTGSGAAPRCSWSRSTRPG